MRSTELLCHKSGGTNTPKRTRFLAATLAGALQIKTEPIAPFEVATVDHSNGADADSVEETTGADRKCFNCDQNGFTPEHIAKCPARNATCNFCRKTGPYERTCRGRRTANRGRVGLIHEDGTDGGLLQNDPEESVSNYRGSVGWVTDSNAPTQGWDSDSSKDSVVMSVWRKQGEELKITGAKLALRINGHATQAWIDSGLPISIFI